MSNGNGKNGKRKIIWSVDPFSDEPAILRSAAGAIRALAGKAGVEVVPVFVWRVGGPGPKIGIPRGLADLAEVNLARALKKTPLAGLGTLVVLDQGLESARDMTRALVAYARKTGAGLIVLSSHARKGLKRAVLGSFAETLSLSSDVPLLIVHPGWKGVDDFRQIIFPTDFSEASREAFEQVLAFATLHGSTVHLYHKIRQRSGYPPRIAVAAAAAVATSIIRKRARQWVERAKARGVPADAIIDDSARDSIADAVARRARKAKALIALASQSGHLSALLLGSTTRELLRKAGQPVWVLHPARKSAAVGEQQPFFSVTKDDVEEDLNLIV